MRASWSCLDCGYVNKGTASDIPEKCPNCGSKRIDNYFTADVD